MNSVADINKIFYDDYNKLCVHLEHNLEGVFSKTMGLINLGINFILAKYDSAKKENIGYLEESINSVYFDLKNKLRKESERKWNWNNLSDIVSTDITDNKFNNFSEFLHSESNLSQNVKTQDLIKINDSKNNYFEDAIKSSLNAKNNYSLIISEVISESVSHVKELAVVMAGKLYNSCSIKNKTSKRLWKWEDRLDYIDGLFLGENNYVSESEQIELKKLRFALEQNKYLRYKKPEYYKKLNNYLKKDKK